MHSGTFCHVTLFMERTSDHSSSSPSSKNDTAISDQISYQRWLDSQEDFQDIAQATLTIMASTPPQNVSTPPQSEGNPAEAATANALQSSTGFISLNAPKTQGKRPATSDPDTESRGTKALKTTSDGKDQKKKSKGTTSRKKKSKEVTDVKKEDEDATPAAEPAQSMQSSSPAQPARPTQTVSSTKAPRTPTDRIHVTEAYERYDPQKHQHLSVPDFKPKNFTFAAFSQCPLYMELTTSSVVNQPKWSAPDGVRLDDYNCAEALLNLAPADMHSRFPAEFDAKAMLRATRNPLGYARKIYVKAGMVDGDGKVARMTDTGYYYAWFKGLQPLMGMEGYKAGLYMVRPSGEKTKSTTLTWFLHSRCVIQYPTGHPSDPTFQPGTLDTALGLSDRVAKTLGTSILKQIEETVKETITQHLQLAESVYDDGPSPAAGGLFGVAEDEDDLSRDDAVVDADEVNALDDGGPRVPLDEGMKRQPAGRKGSD